MSIASGPGATAPSVRTPTLSSIRRHLAAIVLVMIFTAGLAVALCLAVSPLDLGPIGLGDIGDRGWTR